MQSLTNAFGLLDVLLEERHGVTLAYLIQQTGWTKNKTFRLLATLEQIGVVEKDSKSKYSLGPSAYGIAHRILEKPSNFCWARPAITQLAERFNESVYFAKLIAGTLHLVSWADCRQEVKAVSMVGKQLLLSNANIITEASAGQKNNVTFFIETGVLDTEVTTVTTLITDPLTCPSGALVVVVPTYRLSMERISSEIIPALAFVTRQLSGTPVARQIEAPPLLPTFYQIIAWQDGGRRAFQGIIVQNSARAASPEMR